jgi:hypothetical protein
MSTTEVCIRRRFPFTTVCVKTVLTFTAVALAGFLILPFFGY